jgi:hypothetical protein
MKLDPRHHVRVTDHALVRWLERVHGIDVEALRRKMLDEALRSAFAAGAVRVKRGSVRFLGEQGVIKTVIGGRKP